MEGRRLDIYREPGSGGYGMVTILGPDKAASPMFAPEARVVVEELLPGRKA